MVHKNYYEMRAASYIELGQLMGELFRSPVQALLEDSRMDQNWRAKVQKSKAYLKLTIPLFPDIYDEIKGYSQGANVPLQELWTLMIEDELETSTHQKCTSLVTNNARLIGHNEDWDIDAKNYLCVVKKKIAQDVIFELHYVGTLGGNAISMNGFGYIQCINSLCHSDHQIGVPKNVISRFLSHTRSPIEDYKKINKIKRASGYHHGIISNQGQIWSIESSAKALNLTESTSPFVHTNHYLSELAFYENSDQAVGSCKRFNYAQTFIEDNMNLINFKQLLENKSLGNTDSLFNQNTLGMMIINLADMSIYVWLLREPEKGWVEYPLDFLSDGGVPITRHED